MPVLGAFPLVQFPHKYLSNIFLFTLTPDLPVTQHVKILKNIEGGGRKHMQLHGEQIASKIKIKLVSLELWLAISTITVTPLCCP